MVPPLEHAVPVGLKHDVDFMMTLQNCRTKPVSQALTNELERLELKEAIDDVLGFLTAAQPTDEFREGIDAERYFNPKGRSSVANAPKLSVLCKTWMDEPTIEKVFGQQNFLDREIRIVLVLREITVCLVN